MSILVAIIYGVIQGLTEFLPVSSSGHLAVLPFFLEFKDPGVFFDLMMHVGTALAILIYFRTEVSSYLSGAFGLVKRAPSKWNTNNRLSWHFFLATLATAVVVFPVKDFAEEHARSPEWIAVNLALFGFLLWAADRYFESKPLGVLAHSSGWKKAIAIGLAQGIAVFPGVSRSGSTITVARALQVDRKEAASFSFLLSLPIILGGALLKSLKVDWSHTIEIVPLLVGAGTSFFVGILTIHFFLKFLHRISFLSFFLYRLVLAAVLILT